jgi:lipid II:glycine glycyltransferase (peptidoglycan interpeptide bridge formation enzyme)
VTDKVINMRKSTLKQEKHFFNPVKETEKRKSTTAQASDFFGSINQPDIVMLS